MLCASWLRSSAKKDGYTVLILAASDDNQSLVKHLVHQGASVGAATKAGGTARMYLKQAGATAAQISYLEMREGYSNPGCDGGGKKRCAVCKEMRYCAKPCQVAHWRVHRASCRPAIEAESEETGAAP
jgi:hypothetical protein